MTMDRQIPIEKHYCSLVGSPKPKLSCGEFWGNKGKVPFKDSKNVSYTSVTVLCYIKQRFKLVVSYVIIAHGILHSIFRFIGLKCCPMTFL